MSEPVKVTEAQKRAYDALVEHQPVSPREFARILYIERKETVT